MLRILTRILALALSVGLVLAVVAPARATTVVPIADDDLIDDAASIVVGRVTAIQSHWDARRRQIFTDITLSLDEVLAGPTLPPTITIRQPGGRVGGLESWIDGAPEFHVGEKALLFLRVAPDGTLRVAHLHQGKFRIIVEPESGDEIGIRLRGGQVRVLAPQRLGPPPQDGRSLDELRRTIRNRLPRRPVRQFLGVTSPTPPSGPAQQTEAFTFIGAPARWFEPDSGGAIMMHTNINGEPRAPSAGFDQVSAALGAWFDPGSSFRFGNGGTTTAAGNVFDGVNSIAFGDPTGQIDPPVNCTGILAQGGFFRSATESRVVNGQSFWRVLEGDVVFADGWQGCGFYEVFGNLAEVATHELGHVLGLGHSQDPDATMYGVAHFDGRGNALRADDRAGLRFIYPLRAPLGVVLAGNGFGSVTSSPAGITCPGDCDEPWFAGATVTLTATPGTGSSTFSGWTGGGCSGTAPCRITLSGPTSVTATFSTSALGLRFSAPASGATVSASTTVSLVASGGSGYSYQVRLDGSPIFAGTSASFSWDTTTAANGAHTLSATVTDSQGRTTTASVPVTVSNTTGGALRVALTQPANGATVSGARWAVMWVEGTTGTSNTFTLTLGGRTMGTSTTSSRGPVSMPYDTRTVADGAQPLTATVRDASGATGSATVTVSVANGGAPPPPAPAPLTAAFTTPGAGATVAGSVMVGMSVSGSTAAARTFQLALDGGVISTQSTSATTASFVWNSLASANGAHTLTLTVTDGNGAGGTATRSVTVQNAGPPPPPPPTGSLRVHITQPTSGATLRGTAWVTLWLDGSSGSSNSYTLSAAGATVATTTTSSTGPVTLAWVTTGTPDGAQTLTASVRDATGNTGATSIPVTVANGGTPPPAPAPLSAAFTSPAAGATVTGTVTVGMAASGASGAATYTLTVDGVTVSTQTTPAGSASYAWSTAAVPDGAHALGLTVTDGAGRTATATRSVTVSNAAPPPASGTLRVFVTSPAGGSTVSGVVWVNIWVEGASGGSNVYTLSVNGVTVATETSSGAHVTPAWDSRTGGNGTRTITATVRDASGNTGAAAVTVTVAN